MNRLSRLALPGAVLFAAAALAQTPVGSALTYQGELRQSGNPVNGAADFRFRLYSADTGGSQLGPEVPINNGALTSGRFTASLDFGAGAFGSDARWLEIDVRSPAGAGAFVTLSPRQRLTAAPVAQFALGATSAVTAANAGQLNGQPGSFYQSASNLTGTLPSGALSGLYSGSLTFSASPAFTGAGSPFSVTSSTLVSNLNADLLDGLNSTAFLQSIPVPMTLVGTSSGHIVLGQNSSTTSTSSGVYGRSSAASGITYGGRFETASVLGIGVFGRAEALSGTNFGGRFESLSPDGTGVYGFAANAGGFNYGVYGRSNSTLGSGVYGTATAATGMTTGVYGESSATSGRGVFGRAISATGSTHGGWFESDSTSGRGVYGRAGAGTGVTIGVRGDSESTSGVGVFGVANAASGTTFGGRFHNDSTSGRGVHGFALASSGTTFGVLGESASTSGRGVAGLASATSGVNYGGRFETLSTDGYGVYGVASATTGINVGVQGVTNSSGGYAVYGVATAASGFSTGGYFQSDGAIGRGVVGSVTSVMGVGTKYAVFGIGSTPSTWAVYASGDLGASGFKSFRIDHPDDPENKYLLHYCAESPEVTNFYSGTAPLDGAGEAVVALPPYFAKINKDPRYTLTAVGAPMPMLHVGTRIDEGALSAGAAAGPGAPAPACSFRIAGGAPGGAVSWRVEALRNDLRMRLRGAPVELDKIGVERGTYQHPEYYGQPAERGMDHRPSWDREAAAGGGNP
ncbi:MAG: hypothetical protein ACKVU4_14705 [Phycisphaerales bacterium]